MSALKSHPHEAKIHPPALTAEQVLRPTILERLCNASTAKLLLLRAPAGFGKSTAMAQAHRQLNESGVDTAWLTLDASDNDTSRFLLSLGMALSHLHPEATGADARNLLASHTAPFVLFLDEFEVIHDAAVHGMLREIIDRLPRRSQIILGSRSVPALELGRLRSSAQLIEIDSELLRFSLQETTDFLRLRNITQMTAETLNRLHIKTEGWAAALWLASITLAQRGADLGFIERFSGSSQGVAAYLTEDVLAQQPPEVRAFLLRTSILKHLTPSLCQALCPKLDADAILSQLEAANLFVTRISGENRTYRYHGLFAEYLRAQLQREQPDEFIRLNLTASGWYESQGRPAPAIDHAIEGGDLPCALELMAAHADEFLEQGRMHLLKRWFTNIPQTMLKPYPTLQVAALWSACYTSGPQVTASLLEQSGCLQSEDEMVRSHMNALQPALLVSMDQYDEAYASGKEGLLRLPSHSTFADKVLTNTMAHVVATMGDLQEAHRLIALARSGESKTSFHQMYSDTLEGALDLQAGHLKLAAAHFRMSVGTSRAAAYSFTDANYWSGVLHAEAMYETNQLEEAEQLLNVYTPLARDAGLPDHVIRCHAMLSRISFQRGDVDQAFEHLIKLEYLGQHRLLPRVVASAKLERSRLLLLQGYGLGAREELERSRDPEVWGRVDRHRYLVHDTDYHELARLRWELTFGDANAAISGIQQELIRASNSGLGRRVLKLQVLLSLAQARAEGPASATQTLAPVLRQCSEEGFMRLILDEGPDVGPLIQRVALAQMHAARAPLDPIFQEYLQRLLKMFASTEPVAEADANTPIPEPLTQKEERVLQLLAEGYSNGAMAEKLFVSDSTIRTHLRNINIKLNAQSRTQAVAIARRLRLIP